MTARKHIVTGMRVMEKTSGKRGEVIDIRFTAKTPYHPTKVQVKWDSGLTTWIAVRKISL
jgi:hypothetical protein